MLTHAFAFIAGAGGMLLAMFLLIGLVAVAAESLAADE